MHLQPYYNLLLWVFAAILNAAMDTVTHHYSTSVFKDLDRRFYEPAISWKYAKNIFGYKFDFWHICKSLMIISIVIFATSYQSITNNKLLDIFILGAIWNIIFNLFYNKVFKSRYF